jgi:hypothetical protein
MITPLISDSMKIPFYFKEIGSVIISESPVVLDLLFLENVNALVLKDYNCFEKKPMNSFKNYVEICSNEDIYKLADYNFSKDFSLLISDLLKELSSTLIGVQVTNPSKHMCSNIHVDKLSLRLVQCLDGVGTTLISSDGTVIETKKNDLIFLKGEMWKSSPGAIKHKSPQTGRYRTLFRIDFLD